LIAMAADGVQLTQRRSENGLDAPNRVEIEYTPHIGQCHRRSSHRSVRDERAQKRGRPVDDDARALRNSQGGCDAPAEDKARDCGESGGRGEEKREAMIVERKMTPPLYKSL